VAVRASRREKDSIRAYVEDQAREEVLHLEKGSIGAGRPGATRFAVSMGTANQFNVIMEWREGDESRNERQTLRV
jgi:hypothetical protein